MLGQGVTAMDLALASYMPGGKAASSIVRADERDSGQGCRCAREIIMLVVPAPDGVLNPAVLGAAHLAGVDRIFSRRWRAGGCGASQRSMRTATIPPTSTRSLAPAMPMWRPARRLVFGQVGIDSIAESFGDRRHWRWPDQSRRWIARPDLFSQADGTVRT